MGKEKDTAPKKFRDRALRQLMKKEGLGGGKRDGFDVDHLVGCCEGALGYLFPPP